MTGRDCAVFGLSFGEILFIALVGLLVLGPKRLRDAMQFLGHWIKRIRRQIAEVQADIRREMRKEDAKGLEEVKKIHHEFTQLGREAEAAFRSAARGASEEAEKIQAEVTRGGESASKGKSAETLSARTSESSTPPSKPQKVEESASKIMSEEYRDLNERVRKLEEHCWGGGQN